MKNATVSQEVFSAEKLDVLIKTANKATDSAIGACRKVAEYLVLNQDTGKKNAEEHKRLMGLCTHAERNARLYIAASLWIAMVPEMEIETGHQGKGDKKSRTLKPAAQCKTAREITAAAKQIRDAEGASDGRANNAKKAKAPEVGFLTRQVTKALEEHSPEIAGIIGALRAHGYKVTAPKSTLADVAPKTKAA